MKTISINIFKLLRIKRHKWNTLFRCHLVWLQRKTCLKRAHPTWTVKSLCEIHCGFFMPRWYLFSCSNNVCLASFPVCVSHSLWVISSDLILVCDIYALCSLLKSNFYFLLGKGTNSFESYQLSLWPATPATGQHRVPYPSNSYSCLYAVLGNKLYFCASFPNNIVLGCSPNLVLNKLILFSSLLT